MTPYSLTPEEAGKHFGFPRQVIYDLICKGELLRGIHYYKVGRKVLIIREKFIEWMKEKDGVKVDA